MRCCWSYKTPVQSQEAKGLMFGLDVAGQEEVTSRLTFTVSTRNRRSQEEIIFVP